MKVPVKGTGPNGDVGYAEVPVQLPHRILEFLIAECGLQIPDELVKCYWQHLDDMSDEVAVNSRQFRAACSEPVWPLGIHGDEASMQLNNAPYDAVYGIWLNLVLFRPKSTRLSRFLLCSVESTKMLTAEATLFPILEVLVNSLNLATESGAAGKRFICTELRGDQAWFRLLFRHKSWWIARNICFRCQACTCKTSLNYLHYNGDWLNTLRTTRDVIIDEFPFPLCLSD